MTTKAYILEAFKQFDDILEEEEMGREEVPIYDFNSENMHNFLDVVGEDDTVDIIDLEAEAEEDLKQSYVGKVILDCNVCHSNIFINKEEVVVDETGSANIDLECPYCMSNEGYTIIGQVEPYGEYEEESEDEEELDIDDEEVEDTEDIDLGESFKRRRRMRESLAEVAPDLDSEPILQFENGDYFYVDYLDGKLVAGSATNTGIIPEYEIEYDEDDSFDGNLSRLYDTIVESNPELLGESIKRRPVREAIQDVTINTDDETMTMTTKEDGGVVVETSPIDNFVEDDIPVEESDFESQDEVIAPLKDEDEDEIELASEVEQLSDEEIDELEKPDEEGDFEDEVEISDFDEESFDELGESYLRKHYDNVEGFKTVNAKVLNDSLIIEGVIRFTSGNSKGTKFVFEGTKATSGGVMFEGYNQQISRGKKTFKMTCSLNKGVVTPKKLSYNYTTKNELNESVRVNGTCRIK